jgi:hypothetical protein
MRNLIKLILVLILLSYATASFAVDTLCTPDEKIIFTCSSGVKVASVCASKDLSPTNGYLQCRYGKGSKIEFIAPKVKKGLPPNLRLTAKKDDALDYNEVSFIQGKYRYSIISTRQFKKTRNGYPTPPNSDSIIVEITNKLLPEANIHFTGACQPDTKPFNAKELSNLIGVPVFNAGF